MTSSITEDIQYTQSIDETVGLIFNRLGFEHETELHNKIIRVLNDETKKAKSDPNNEEPSKAAMAIREMLWAKYGGGVASAVATVLLFESLDRADELSWIVNQYSY